ncbi:HTTM domain-containing protein [Leucobacter sp. OLJS4]|uniref:HTTM domain-containing protein n=1 Tax=unclassified Leucobacter TaxID=2621730 RepID=UPI000C19A8D6|nr:MULTISPECIES: HTTM domain-containing protein [unclassified Leucobacter]PIJ52546.1 HTTM domain-containing protein [Leucobacter sp. OLES1]PII83691.1 HTTM domain-containing protein [Leucobacter sp. OLCALW19]PII87049.1 HTTM domain-containing protein [Leucobacter sp. OLTLW20]PII89483.1 HTTM domain-containing protein [Leucobacter sp. OLAS13]PII97944.1 HTTM domain-containing protein [Leucobacter sp. OLDS2]
MNRVAQFGAFVWSLIVVAVRTPIVTIGRGLAFFENWLLVSKKSLYGLAVTRILFGATGLGLLLANFSTRLYTFGPGSAWNGELAEPVSDFPKIWIFSLFHAVAGDPVLYTVCYVALMALAVLFILGWRFRIVLPIFFVGWVGFIEANDMVGDQGDNMFRIAMILLFFADPAARWSLDARRRAKREWFAEESGPRQIGNALHNLALIALTAQVMFVYASGGLYKASGSPWSEGYAVYNPLHTMRFGTWPVLSDLVTTWGPMVAVASWGSIILQVAFPLALLSRPTRIIALFGILGFHIAIAVLMGLPWFSLTMIAIDSIFIRDRSWQKVSQGVKDRWRTAMGRAASPPTKAPVEVSA